MALTLPTPEDLYNFWGADADETDDDRATDFIAMAADLLWLATDLEDDPTDARLNNLVQLAILDMAIYMLVSYDDITEQYSPFQSERIGSYSYSKASRLIYNSEAKNVGAGVPTGAILFDKVVQYYLDEALFGNGGLITSEQVFHYGYVPLRGEVALERSFGPQDPSSRNNWYRHYGSTADDEGSNI